MQPDQSTAGATLEAHDIHRFLSVNPDFFDKHQDLLERLRVPHVVAGGAVSLVEKQVSVLRAKCMRLETSLRDLIGVARDNEELHLRLHALIRDVVSAPDVASILELAGDSLSSNFNASDVRLLLLDPSARRRASSRLDPSSPRVAAGHGRPVDEDMLGLFEELFDSGATFCGMPDAAQLELMVGDDWSQIASAALIPLAHEGRLGVLMLGSRDESRFSAGKGVLFLDQLGEVLSRRMHVLGVRPQ